MRLKLWQVDAFAARPLEGNPAAVVPLESWLDDGLMQRIAAENNLSETAYLIRRETGRYDLRWFTPKLEVDLCGHATLASAWVVLNVLETGLNEVRFATRSGELTVTRGSDGRPNGRPNGRNVMSLPSNIIVPYNSPANIAEQIGEALGIPPPEELHKGINLVAVWDDPAIIRAIAGVGTLARVLYDLGIRGLIVTAPGDGDYDCVSRYFAPSGGIPEDPVTGSAHAALTPYWSKRLGKKQIKARQASPRGGDLYCTDAGERTIIAGDCALYLTGEIEI